MMSKGGWLASAAATAALTHSLLSLSNELAPAKEADEICFRM